MNQPTAKQPLQIGTLARDVVIVIGVPWVSGLALGASGVPEPAGFALLAWSIGFGTVGFGIVAYIAKDLRAAHIMRVAFGAWLYGLLSGGSGIQSLVGLLLSAGIIATTAVAGVGVGYSLTRIKGRFRSNKYTGTEGNEN